MRPEEKHITFIQEAWSNMLTKEDLLDLLNYAKPLVYGKVTSPFELKQLTWYANPKINSKRYKDFEVKKKSGGIRTIHAPVKGLKAIQKTLAFVLQCIYTPHPAAMGFTKDRSVVDNARLHVGQKYIYNVDLKDFFPSIDQARVWKCFQLSPFNINNDKIKDLTWHDILKPGVGKVTTSKGEVIYYNVKEDRNHVFYIKKRGDYHKWFERIKQISAESGVSAHDIQTNSFLLLLKTRYDKVLASADKRKLSNMMAAICCTEMEVERKNEQDKWIKVKKSVLPQGAPTSPILSNIVCQKLDFLLSGVAKRFGMRYSRYADDITFSSMHNAYQENGEFLTELNRLITQQGFHIKESKTRLQKNGYRKEVTGLLVNEKANVQQRYIKQIRKWLYYWERYGYERAEGYFFQDYFADKGHIKSGRPNMANVVGGKLEYLKMVKGTQDPLYLKLMERFNALILKYNAIDMVLDQWESNGIEEAMVSFIKITSAKNEQN